MVQARTIQKRFGRNVTGEEFTLEERVAELERQVGRLTKHVFQDSSNPGWVRKIVGSMENDPDFAEILKLGREIREADRRE
jgi:hypothetical protein